ncbi:MAG TPA: hypothetical protein VJI98_01815 [Candidatus Nanoarchaeia archaeon]|nr:hypothetical protein [Candidatus Nanoarchaeia archaeon]
MNILKKLILGLLLLLFTLSIIPAVLAEDDINSSNNTEDSRDRPARTLIRDQTKIISENDTPRERLANAREKVIEARERVQKVREQYSVAKRKYDEAKDVYNTNRDRLIQLRDRAKECDENCQVRRTELKLGTLNHLIKTSELIEKSVEKLISRLGEAPISDEEKARALEALEAVEVKVIEQREKVENLTANATNDEVREAIADLKQTWKDVRMTQRRIIASLTDAKFENLIEKHQEYDNGLSLRIDQLREKGVDVARLEGLQRQFQTNLEKLVSDYEIANGFWMQTEEGLDKLDEWHTAQLRVREDLKESQLLLRRFLAVYRELQPLAESE